MKKKRQEKFFEFSSGREARASQEPPQAFLGPPARPTLMTFMTFLTFMTFMSFLNFRPFRGVQGPPF